MDKIIKIKIRNTDESYVSAFKVLKIIKKYRDGRKNFSSEDIIRAAEGDNIVFTKSSIEPGQAQGGILLEDNESNFDSSSKVYLYIQISDNENSENDVFSLRFIPLLMEVLMNKKYDRIILKGGKEYSISSFLCGGHIVGTDYEIYYESSEGKIKKFHPTYSLTTERLPLIRISSLIYDILKGPIKYDWSEKLKFTKIIPKTKKDIQKLFCHIAQNNLQDFIERISVNEIITSEFIQRLESVPCLAVLLFSTFWNHNWKSRVPGWKEGAEEKYLERKTREYVEAAYRDIEVASDYSDGLLQAIENIISHTDLQIGTLSIKGYDNFLLLDDNFERSEDYLNKYCNFYWRIYLSDYSEESILEKLKKKTGKSNLTLKNIFYEGDDIQNPYLAYLNKDENFLHHYGLQAFANAVEIAKGYFHVASASFTNTSKQKGLSDEYYYQCNSGVIKAKTTDLKGLEHLPGTEYEIILPHLIKQPNSIDTPYVPSIYNQSRKKIYYGLRDYFLRRSLGEVEDYKNFQEQKEKTIDKCVEELSNALVEVDADVIYFDFCNAEIKLPLNRVEVMAKIILGVATKLKNICKCKNFVIYTGENFYDIVRFFRQFACFYTRKGVCGRLKDTQCYFISINEKGLNEALIYYNIDMTRYLLNTEINYYCNVSNDIKELLDHFYKKFSIDKSIAQDYIVDSAFDIVEVTKDGKTEPIFIHKLRRFLEADIHNKSVADEHKVSMHGCKIPDTHIRLTGVHQDTFYEAQHIFTNSYWVYNISRYLARKIEEKLDEIEGCDNLVLYGYETYCEPLLFKLKELLANRYQVDYIVYETPKFIRQGEKSKETIRYLDNVSFKSSTVIIYIVGISATLKTFKDIDDLLCQSKKIDSQKKIGFNVINVLPKNNQDEIAKKILTWDEGEKKIKSNQHYLDFLVGQQAQFVVSLFSNWYDPYNCPLCNPKDFIQEKFLTETDETSTVPFQRLNITEEAKDVTISRNFIGNVGELPGSSLESRKFYNYLYYNHIERGGNHYQYYIRTAHLLSALYKSSNQIDSKFAQWLKTCKDKVETTAESTRVINIIAAPIHYSNEAFVNVINYEIFGGQAYIINFNPRKEFRGNFGAKYYYYGEISSLVERTSKLFDHNTKINCYYVDDQILSGTTFSRTKNLLYSLLHGQKHGEEEFNTKTLNIFSGIFTLVDQHSESSKQEFFFGESKFKEKFNAFIQTNIPSIRTYGDSCPLCASLDKAKSLSDFGLNENGDVSLQSMLWGMQSHWRHKYEYHRLISLNKAKEKVGNLGQSKEVIRIRNWFRFVCENEVWILLKQYERTNDEHIIYDKILELFDYVLHLENIDSDLIKVFGTVEAVKIEYCISYIKVLSRPTAIYGEHMRKAVISILLQLYCEMEYQAEELSSSIKPYSGKIKEIISLLFEYYLYILKNVKDGKEGSEKLIYSDDCITRPIDFLRVLIARLCSIGSSCFINVDRIQSYRRISNLLQNYELQFIDKEADAFIWYNLKKLTFFGKEKEVKGKLINDIAVSNLKACKCNDLLWVALFLEMPLAEETLDKVKLNSLLSCCRGEDCDYKQIGKHVCDLLNAEVSMYVYDNSSLRSVFGKAAKDFVKQDDLNLFGCSLGGSSVVIKFGDYVKDNINIVLPIYWRIDYGRDLTYEDYSRIKELLWSLDPLRKSLVRDFNNRAIELTDTQEYFINMLASKKTVSHNTDETLAIQKKIIQSLTIDSSIFIDAISVYEDLIISFVFRSITKLNYFKDRSKTISMGDFKIPENEVLVDLCQNGMFDIPPTAGICPLLLAGAYLKIIEGIKRKFVEKQIELTCQMPQFTADTKYDALDLKGCFSSFLPLASVLLRNVVSHGSEYAYFIIASVCETELIKRREIYVRKPDGGYTNDDYQVITKSYDIIVCNKQKDNLTVEKPEGVHISHIALEWLLNGVIVSREESRCPNPRYKKNNNERWNRYERENTKIFSDFKNMLSENYNIDLSFIKDGQDEDKCYWAILKNIAWEE